MLLLFPLWQLMATTTLMQVPATFANAIIPSLSYLPPTPDNILYGALPIPSGRPSIPGLLPPPPPPTSRPAPGPSPVVIPFPEDIPPFQTSPGSGVIPFPPSFGSLGNTNPGASDRQPPSSVTSSGCPEACTKIYIPLCGTDGVTYNNKCLLDIANCKGRSTGINIGVVFEGTCESSMIPAAAIRGSSLPVQGSSTLPIQGSSSLPVELGSSSFSSSCDKECTKIFSPVCGTDDTSYNSPCLLEIASCESVRSGDAPVNVDYEGHCVLRHTALFVAAMTPSRAPSVGLAAAPVDSSSILAASAATSSQTVCPEACTKIFRPVCGSDDQSYNNECILNATACRSRSTGRDLLFKAFDGPCVAALPRGPVCDHACDKTFVPICGSDGETYNNLCLLNLANCLNPFATITYAADGRCDSVSSAGLSSDPRPIISILPSQSATPNLSASGVPEYIPHV